MDQDDRDRLEAQTEQAMNQTEHSTATQAAARRLQEKVENPEFLAQLQEADLDSGVFDWLEDELGPLVSGAHILGNRDKHYEEQQYLLNRNKAERLIAERTPGRLLEENPRLHALAQGCSGWQKGTFEDDPPAEYREPLSSRKKRALRHAIEVLTNRETLAIDGRGLDAVANATVERRSVKNEETESDTVRERISTGVFG